MEKKPVVLLIEDDNLISRMYQDKFTQEGYQVNVAFNGEEGLIKLKQEKPILILLDIVMPKMNGFEVLEKIKTNPEFKKIPVILLTSMDELDAAKKGLKLGASAYLIKSNYSPDQIISLATEILVASNSENNRSSEEK